jgi:hypothetical protein
MRIVRSVSEQEHSFSPYTIRVPYDIAKRTIDLYHNGQFRGLSGSPSSQSTSKAGSVVHALAFVAILVAGGRDTLETCGVRGNSAICGISIRLLLRRSGSGGCWPLSWRVSAESSVSIVKEFSVVDIGRGSSSSHSNFL